VYHARTVKAHTSFLALAAVLAAGSSAWAQHPPDGESPPGEGSAAEGASTAPGAYPTYRNERHLLVRLLGGSGLGFNNAYGRGLVLPPFVFLQGSFTFLNVGAIHMGPSLGAQSGLDFAHSGVQWTVQPGWMVHYRPTSALALNARLDVPFLFTRGVTQPEMVNPSSGQAPVYAPIHHTLDAGFGIEAGLGAAYYLTAGLALTAELSGGFYFGDSFYTFPYVGLGLGVLVDFEILP
jgi:hypothetical protein